MTLFGFKVLGEELRKLEAELKVEQVALRKARKAGVDEWWVDHLLDRIGVVKEKIIQLKQDIERLRGK